MVLDAWIIDDIKRNEDEVRRRRDQDRPLVYIEISDTVPPRYRRRENPRDDRDITIIPPADEDPELGTVINFATESRIGYSF